MISRSNLFIAALIIIFLIRWYFFGGYFLIEENTTLLAPMQEYLVGICQQVMPEPQSSLLAGILIGEKQSLDPDFKKALINTSTIHMVVVSGQNLSMLAGFLLTLAPWIGRKKTIVGTIAILVGYSILTGLQVPVIRAAFMSIMSLLGWLINREVNALKVLIYSALLMLILNPTWIDSISFQLSFMATVGVMVLAPELHKADRWLPDFIKGDFWVSLSAQLLTLPIIAINFHRVSIVGLLSNLLVLWTIAPVMITGIVSVIVALFSPFLGAIFGLVPGLLLLYFTKVIEITNQSWSSLSVPYFTDQFWAGYYITFIGIYLFFKAKNSKTDSKIVDSPRVLTA